MRNFVINLLTCALALWLTAWLLPGVDVKAYGPGLGPTIVTYLVVALIFGLVNAIIAPLIKFATFCFYVLTLGLFGLLVNGFLFWLVSVISGQIGWGLSVKSFWWGVLGAVVMAIASMVIGALTAGLRKPEPPVFD